MMFGDIEKDTVADYVINHGMTRQQAVCRFLDNLK